MPLQTKKLKSIYNALQSDGFETQTYDEFQKYFTGRDHYANRKKVYDFLMENGASAENIGGTYEDFMSRLRTPQTVAAVPLTEDKKRQLQADMDLMQADMDLTMRQAELDMQDARERTKKPLNVRKMNLTGGNNIFDNPRVRERKKARYDGRDETVYLTESGNEYGSRAMADVEQGQLDEARFMRENKRAYLMREKERIEREMNQRRGEVKRAEEEKYKKIWDGPLKYLSSMPRGGGVGFNPSADNLGVWGDKKYKTLNAQLKQVEDALATLDEAEAGKKSDAWIADSSNAWERNAKKLAGFGGGAWRGLAHSVGKISTWDFGITDMETNKSVLDAANAVDKGTEATKEDQELLDLVAYKNMVEKESEPYLGYGYTAGSITGESLPFMLEMAINPASGVGKGAMKASMRGMLKKYGKEKLKSNFKKYLLAKAGARVAGDVAGAHAMALTTGQGRVIADTMRRLTGDVQYGVNDNGQIVYSGRKVDVDGLAEAYLKSFESQAIENHSEMLGEYFAPLLTRAGKAIGKPIGKGLEKLRLGGVNRFIEDVGASKTAKLIDDFSKKTQWNGSIGEYAEEVAGGIENAMIVGDQTLDTDEQTGVFNLEKNIETFLGVGLMGGFMFGAKLASYRGPKRGALQEMEAAGNRVDRALGGKMQARAQWGEWRSKLLLGNEEEKKNTLREIMDNEKLPIQFRNAVADFSRAAQKYEGLCRAEQSKRLEGTADPVGSSLDDAADAGYELNDPQEMTRTRLALDSERERMAAYLGVEVDQVDATVGENLFDYVDNLRNRGVTGEELNRVMDYARARSRYEGMQMRLEDDTNTRIDNVHANMARYAHRENGTVQTGAVKTKDGSRPVWIVSGNLVFEGEGKDRSINPMKSDESIFVIDAKTGQAEMHPATDFVSLGEPVSAEEVNAYYESSVREQMKKAFEANTHAELSEEKPAEDGELAPANETEGAAVEPTAENATESTAENATEPAKPAYEVGDVVTLETEDGPVSVEVQAVTADGVEVRTDEPWRGQVVQVIPTEEFEGMMKKPVVEAGVGVEESSATESNHYTEGSPERVEAGDNLIVTDEEGNDRSLKVVRRVSMRPSEKGGLEPQEDANGKIVELVDDATGETVRMWDSELAERTKGYMRPQQGVMPSPKSTEGEGVEQAEQVAPAAEPAQPKRNEIPVDEKTGEPVYEAADPGAAWDALVEEAEGDEELAMETVNAMVRDMEEKVKKAKNAKLRAGATAHEKMEAQKERKRHIAEAEERLESWKRIAGVKAERAAAAEASVVESSVSESPVVESPATVETPAAEEATPVQEGAQTPVQEGARGGVQVPHADSAGQEATQDSVTGTAPVAEQTGTTPKGVEAIPTRKNNKGEEEALYHKVPVARTMADLYDGGMDQEEIDGFVEANSAEAAREVKRIEGKKPKMTTNKAKYMEAKRAWQAELDEAREKEAYWKEVGKEVKRVTHRDEAPVSAEGRGHEAALGEDMPKDEPMDVYEVVASALGRGRIKITPESFRAETGYSVNDQKKYPGMVASAENGGVSVERAAEMLMEDADMAGFPSDDYTIRQAIIDVLQDGHPAGYISRRREEARRRAAERDEREREEYYQDRYGMNADDGMAYEETAVPNALNQYGGVSEDELAAQSAEAAEAERMKREEDEQGNRAEDGGQQMAGKEEGAGNEAASEVEEMPAAHEPAVDSSMPKTSFTQDEAADFVDKMEARAESVPEMELTIENWDSLFGEDGRVETPIGEVKMGENQFAKLMRQGRNGKLGMIKPTLESPDIIIEQASMAKEGDVTERPSSYLFIKAFTKPDGGRFYYFTSVSVSRDGKEVIISNQEKSRNKILRLMTEESVIWRTPNDAATSSAEKQGLDYAHPNNAEDETKGSGITPQSTSSAGKVTESQETEQGNEVASEVEEGGKQMEGEEKTNTFSLSEMDSGKGGRLYQDAAGNTNLVSIPNEVFEAMGMSPVPFSLTESMAEHVLKHKTELGLSSKEDAVRYVVAVMKNADHVRAGDKPGSFVFSVENGRRKVGKRAIAVQVDGSSGKFLGISTSGNERVSNLQKRPLLWEKGVNETSATGSAPANVTSETAEQNGGELDGNASNQSNDLSADKVTESKETEQVGARVKAEGEEAEVSKDETPKEYKYRRNSDIDTLPDGYLRLGKDERGFDVAFYDHPLSRKEVERFHMGPITESNELVGKVYEVTRGLVTITYRVVGAEDGFVLFTDNGSFDYRTLPYYKFMDWVVAKGKEVGTEVKASGKAREARAKDGTQPVSESEAGLRDALVDVARAAGVEVVTDSKEGQRVLDEVNGKARLSAKQKRALETASLGNDPRSLTVVSSATGAKVLNNLDALAASLENSATQPKIFLGQVANALGASNKGSSSQYATFETKNGAVVTIRLANHNASSKRMDNAGRSNAISIVVSPKPNEGILNDGNAHVVEFYYDSIKLRKADGHPLAEIVRSIQQALYSGEYKDTTGLAERQEVNTTFENLREHRVFHGSGAEFEEFDHSHMGEGEGAQAYGWGTYVTEVEGIGRAYASQNKGRISYKGKSVQEIQKLYEEGVSPYNVVFSVVFEMESGLDFSQAKEILKSEWKSSLEYDVAEGDEESADGWRENLSELASLEESDFSKREGNHLYTVEIPEDNGTNYLHWEEQPGKEQLSAIAEALKADGWSEAEGNHPTFTKNDNKIVLNERAAGCDVYAELEEAMGSQQKASEFLSSIGFTGISYPAQFRSGGREDNSRNFVIFNEKDAQITDHVRFFKTENGEAYGFTVGGKVYLDPNIATTETAVHELTHLWADMLRKENPKEWKHVVELMKGTPVWDEVKAKYPELKTEDEIADEVLAHYSGRRGAERLRAEQQRLAREEGVSMLDRASAVAAIERVKDALNSFWKKVADLLGIHFKSAEEVADAALADILNGRVKPQHIGNDSSMSVSDFAAKHDVNKEDVKKYAQSMKAGNLGGASYAFKNIKRSIWLANDNLSLSAFVKVFSPVRDELYSLFGNIDELRNEHIKIEMDNRNAMEAARKREEEQAEAERKRLEEFELMSDESLDKAYMEAVRSNDEKRMRDLVNEAARRKGYLSTDEFRMSHRAPSYDEEGVDKSMIDIASNKDSIRDSLEEQSRMNRDKNREESIAAISQALQEIEKGNIPDVTIYRAVPKSLKEGGVRNGDWVTLSESYAKQHGNHALNGEYRIMKEVVPADNLYWDGNDINEWGYDDRRDYVYRNTRNNRKLNELVVRDDKGEIIPLSKRFNSRKKDVRFQLVGEKGEKNMVSPLEMSEEEKHERGVQLVNAPAVDVASGQIVKTDKLSARKAAEQWWGEHVPSPLHYQTEIGEVVIDDNSIGNSLAHRYGQAKLDAITSLEEGFKNAVYLGSMKDFSRDGNVFNHYFAYPINYDGKRNYVFCRALNDANGNRLYVHEVFVADKIEKGNTLQTAASQPHGGIALYKDILANVLDAAKVVEEFENPNVQGQETDDASYREVEQGELLDELRKASKEGRTVRVYRTMQVIDGKLYSPMAKKVAGQETSEIKFRWEAAEEHPELARRGDGSKAMPNEESFYITIDKGQGKGALTVAYNPYTHTSRTVLNDQFSSAFVRPNLVVVEVEVPESELEGLYKAEKAKDSVGEMSWHSGAVSGKLAELGNPRKVILSRYDRPVRILTKKEEAELIAKQLEGTGIAMPYNLVTPQVREELEKLGVKIDEKPSGSVSKNASFGKAEYVTDEQIETMNGRLQANAVSSPEAMTEAARALSEQLGVPVEIVTDVDSITHPNEAVEAKRRSAKGWYDKRTGKVAVVVPNHLDVEDVAATVFHEVVAHRGLRELVGEQGYDEFLMEVFNHSKADVRERMMALAGKHGWDIPKAVDEYLGGLAERGFEDFSEAERGMWTWLKEKVLEAIDKFIGTLKLPKSVKLGDNELRYLLWRSHENLRAGREGMVKRAMDVAKRYELGLLENEAGERMIDRLETYRSAENRGNTRALPIRERAKAIAHLKPVLVERNEMSKEELRQIYNALPDAVKDGRSISFYHSAFKKIYKEKGLFKHVVPYLKDLLEGSVFAYSEGDNLGGMVRPDKTVHKEHPNVSAFDNYVGKIRLDGKDFYVRFTVQQSEGNNSGTHSFMVTEVDLYEKTANGLSLPITTRARGTTDGIVDAKLRQFFDEARREDKASEEEDLYRTAYHEAAARDAYERRVKSGLYQSREALQDSMLGLRTAMDEVLKAEGNGYSGRVEDIPGFENAYLGENRLSSVNQAEVDEFGRRLFKPLLEIAASFGSSREARQALTDYMMAKHGLERNALMRERAKKKAMEELEGDKLQKKLDSIEKRDFAGLTALTGEKKVADAEQAARKMVADFEQASGQNGDPNRIAKLWKAVHGVTGATLKKMKDSGLITKEQFDEISGMYDFYIPLRGFDGQTAEDVYDYLGHGGNGSAFTSPIKKAEGRKSKADDPFAYMAAMAESAIMQGNRNVLVKQKFLNFVLNHPSDLVSVSDLWLRYDAASGEWRVAQSGDIVGTEKLEEGDSPEEVERKMAVFEERMQAEAKAHPKEYKRQKEHPEIPYRVVEKQDLREHQVIVKRNGRDYVLTINGSPRAAQALNGLTNPNLDVSGVAGTLMNGVRNTTNYLSQVYTTRNPNFVGSNWARDAIYSNIMAGLKEDKEYGLEFSKAWLEANPGSMSYLYYLYAHGELDMYNEKQRLFAEFMANGGETGYMSFRQIEERKNEIERQLKLYDGKMPLRKGWSGAWNLVDYANRVVENQSRFAAYMASRRSGRTIDRSIYDAKEITVNFNKKGAGSTFYNAKNQTLAGKVAGGVSGIGRFGFAFWNAAIQGTTNFARFVKRNPKKGVAVSLAMMAMGYAVPFIASLLHDDDDDKEGSGYFDLPDAVRRDNFVFRFPGMESWITIPLPVEYRALYGMGELAYTAMYRASIGMPMTAGEIAGQAMGQISQLMPLDLSEGGGMDFTWGASGNFNALAPSAVKPVAEAWTNKSWTGLPVYKDTPYNKQDPEWTKAFKNTNMFLVKMCKQLNEWTGGDSVKGGAVDLNPAVMEHLLKGYLGGIMQTANQIGKLGETIFGDRENEFRNWPVVSRFLQEGDERTKWRSVTERYFNLKKEAEETDRLLKRYKKLTELGEDHQADIDELIKTDAYKRMEVYDFFENDIQKIQDVLKRNDLSEEEREQVEGELNEIRLELLKAVDELGNLTGLGTGRLGVVTGDLLAE